MADTAKSKVDGNQEETSNQSDSDMEDTKDKKPINKKGDKKNASAPAVDGATTKIKPPAKKRVKAEQAENKEKEKEEPKSKKTRPAPKPKKEEEEESDEEENGIEKVPLLDQPLEVTGSRERKQVDLFISEYNFRKDLTKKIEIPTGGGTELGKIPVIKYQINKLKSDDLKLLHRILFNRVGQTHSIKSNLSKFSGFDFDKDSSEYKKKLSLMAKLKKTDLKTLCTILDLAKGGKQSELAENIVEFLIKPVDSGKELPDPRPKRKGTSSKSYKELKTDRDDEKKRGKGRQNSPAKKSSKASSDYEEDENDEAISGEDEEDEEEEEKKKTDEDGEEEDEEDAEDSVASEDEKPKKTAKKRALPPPKKAAAAAATAAAAAAEAPKKKAAAKGPSATTTANNKNKEKSKAKDNGKPEEKFEEKEESNHQLDTESKETKEPTAKKHKPPLPTDDEITSYVKSILDGADLKEITMNTVCSKVYEHYPDFDLSHKKKLIKSTVKSLIMS